MVRLGTAFQAPLEERCTLGFVVLRSRLELLVLDPGVLLEGV